MRFLAPLLVLAQVVVSSPLVSRDAQSVYDSITNIDVTVRNLTSKLTPYQGGILETEPFLTAGLPIHKVNREGKARADASAPFSSAESKRIIDHVNDSVGISIPAGVEVLKSKKEFFDQAEITSVVRSFVTLLRRDHDTFSASVGAKLSPDQLLAGGAAAGKIDAVLRETELFLATP